MNKKYGGLVSNPRNTKDTQVVKSITYTTNGTVVETVNLNAWPAATESDTPTPTPVDLGLPSGTKWATMNVGATAPEEDGLYFSWGNVEGADASDADAIAAMTMFAYRNTSGAGLSADIPATAANDAAVANLGSPWRMPTKAEFKELADNCDWTWKQVNGVNGYEVKSKASGNNNSIFLPAAGLVDNNGSLVGVGVAGIYYSSSYCSTSNAYSLRLLDESVDTEVDVSRFMGLSIRPVYDDSAAQS